MAIRVAPILEPLSRASLDPDGPGSGTLYAECDAHKELIREIRAYAAGQICGRSILVAGHRGSGKTTLVHKAIQDVRNESMRPEETSHATAKPGAGPRLLRPLLVPLHAPSLFGALKGDSVTQNAQKEITRALHRALSEEIARWYRDRCKPGDDQARLEMAAQLVLELDRSPDAATLRDFWDRAGFLYSGVVCPATDEPDQGLRELIALSTLIEVERAIFAKPEAERQQRTEGEKQADWISASMDALRGGVNPIAIMLGLLSAAIVMGLVLSISHNPVLATVGAGSIGVITMLMFSYFANRAHRMSLLADTSGATFDRALPLLVNRVRDIGLAPIFVLDELDKFDNLEHGIDEIFKDIRHFITEKAFFCFISDRDYYETILGKMREHAYPKEHTYFRKLLYMHHLPGHLHEYLKSLLLADPGDQARADLLSYALLQRARMHIGDLHRFLSEITLANGELLLEPDPSRSLAVKLQAIMQASVEFVLNQPDTQDWMRRNPSSRQVAYDALYYPSRQWRQPGFDPDFGKFRVYLESRTPLVTGASRLVSEADLKFLFEKLTSLVGILVDPQLLTEPFENRDEEAARERFWNGLPEPVRKAITDRTTGLLKKQFGGALNWAFDEYGRVLDTGAKPGDDALIVLRRAEALLQLDLFLRDFSGHDLTIACRLGLLDESLDWPALKSAIDRYRGSVPRLGDYADKATDERLIGDCFEMVERRSLVLRRALTLAGVRVWSGSQKDLATSLTIVSESFRGRPADEIASELDDKIARLKEEDPDQFLAALFPVEGPRPHEILQWLIPLRLFLASRRVHPEQPGTGDANPPATSAPPRS